MSHFGRFALSPRWGLVCALALASLPLSAARSIPPAPFQAPEYYVLDEPKALPEGTRGSIQRLLTEHDHLNDEQVVLAIFSSAEGEDPEVFTRRVFDTWKVGQRGKDNGALLALFQKERRAALMSGSGLEATLGEEERQRIEAEIVRPEIRRGDVERASALGVLALLESLHSPLVSSGKAAGLLRSGGFSGGFEPVPEPGDSSFGWWAWIAIGALVFVVAFLTLTAAEAHFTSSGWFRPSPWRWARWKFELWNPRKLREHLGGSHGSW